MLLCATMKFEQNGRCGYILKPAFLRGLVPRTPQQGAELGVSWVPVLHSPHQGYWRPHDPPPIAHGQRRRCLAARETVPWGCAGRRVAPRRCRGCARWRHCRSGTQQERQRQAAHRSTNVFKTTRAVPANGLNPVWLEEFSFSIQCLEFACLTVTVLDNSSGKEVEIADNTISVGSLRLGYRAVPLRHVNTNYILRHASVLCHFALQEA